MEDNIIPKLLTIDVFRQSRPKELDMLRHLSYLSRSKFIHTSVLHDCKRPEQQYEDLLYGSV